MKLSNCRFISFKLERIMVNRPWHSKNDKLNADLASAH